MNIVRKFGGRYVRDMACLAEIVSRTAETYQAGDRLVLVVDATQTISDSVSANIAELSGDVSIGKLDMLLGSAEQQTALLIAAALEQKGLRARAILDIRGNNTDVELASGKHTIVLDEIIETLNKGKIAVVAGYQGIGNFGLENVTGRSGAEATAVAVAAGLGMNVEFYGNTDGITAVPGLENVKMLPVLDYEEAMELVLLSDSDLQTSAVELASQLGVEIYVGSGYENDGTGTLITGNKITVEENVVTGLTVSKGIAIYTVYGLPEDGRNTAEILEILGEMKINLDLISKQLAGDGTSVLSFSCAGNSMEDINRAFSSNPRMRDLRIESREDLIMVSIVGAGMASNTGVASRVFEVLEEHGIAHYNITTSEISVTATIDSYNEVEALSLISQEFRL